MASVSCNLLGVHSLVLTNAAGGINLSLQQGGLVLISDHINLQGVESARRGERRDFGPRFPDMTEAYCERFRDIARSTWPLILGIPLSEGVYAAILGPCYETPAEIRYLRTIGADLVGMSTVPEVIVANHMGMKVLAISCVTNMAAGILPQKIDHEEVLETGRRVRETLVRLLRALLPSLTRRDEGWTLWSRRRWMLANMRIAPFSDFKVGAALEDSSGAVHTGCNIENATYGLTMCAERVAVFKAMSEGARRVPADRGRGGYRCIDTALRLLPADLWGVLRRHRGGAGEPAGKDRSHFG